MAALERIRRVLKWIWNVFEDEKPDYGLDPDFQPYWVLKDFYIDGR